MFKRLSEFVPFFRVPAEVDPDGEARAIAGAGLAVFLLFFVLGGAWLTLAPLSGAVVAQGVLKVEDSRKVVQHLEGGIVHQILVAEGDRVVAGQPLIVLGDAQANAVLNLLQGQLDAELAKEGRLNAEAASASVIRFPEELTRRMKEANVAELLHNEESLFRAKRISLEGQIRLIENQIAQTRGEVQGLAQQIQYADEGIGYLNEQLAANEKLQEKGFIQKTRLLDFRRALSEKMEKRGEYVANSAMASQKTSELELRIISMRNAYQQDAINELKETRKRIFDLQDRLQPTSDMLKRLTVTAPVAGQVVGLRVHTPGGAVAPREALLEIVPAQSPLVVECKVQPQDIANVKAGQAVEMRFTAFNRRTTPVIDGKVKYVSADSFTDSVVNGGRNYFLVHVEPGAESLAKLEGKQLVAGMPVEVYINTGERTAFEYLMNPVISSFDQAFREP